jgi:hypothetical protein
MSPRAGYHHIVGDTANTSASKYYHTVVQQVAGLLDAQKHCGVLIGGAPCLVVTKN